MTNQDMGRIKGGLRRAFARSSLYEEVRAKYRVEHADPVNNPRCKKWAYCAVCGVVMPEWKTEVDHIDPVVPFDQHFEDMSLTDAGDRIWCDINNLQVVCDPCHNAKSRLELEQRKPYKKPVQRRKKK